jgi:4-hydroxybenzoate polyprenyltransferase
MSSTKKTFINIPLLLVTVFASMPMVVFQLAKDMKIDPGLLFISSIALYIMYYLYTKFQSQKFTDKQFLSYVFVLALIVGFTFTMKFTSLLLIS